MVLQRMNSLQLFINFLSFILCNRTTLQRMQNLNGLFTIIYRSHSSHMQYCEYALTTNKFEAHPNYNLYLVFSHMTGFQARTQTVIKYLAI